MSDLVTTPDAVDARQVHGPARALRLADVWAPSAGVVSAEDAPRHEAPGRSLREVHDRRYRDARARGWPGWGGPERIAGGENFVDRMLLNGPVPVEGTVLELGCGAGHVGRCLAARGYRVSGIDFSTAAIDWARDEARVAGMRIDYAVADLGRDPLPMTRSAGHDLVVDANCLHCVVEDDARRRLLASVRAALASHGTFFVSARCTRRGESIREIDGLAARRFRSPDLLVEELRTAGFRTVSSSIHDRGEDVHVELWAQRSDLAVRPALQGVERVRFSDAPEVFDRADRRFDLVARILRPRLPRADVLHVGSTAVRGTLTKGDLDVVIRVDRADFGATAEVLARLARPNTGSTGDDAFRAFACDAADPPTGLQLVVRGTRLDRFHTWTARLREDAVLRERYDALKRVHDGDLASAYRHAKAAFIAAA